MYDLISDEINLLNMLLNSKSLYESGEIVLNRKQSAKFNKFNDSGIQLIVCLAKKS
jgi:hypothetical protein